MDGPLESRDLDAAEVRALLARSAALPAQTIAALVARGACLALAESCTGGLCAARLTDVSGASEAFVSSAVVYQTRAKTSLVGLDAAFVARCGPVSAPVTRALAEAARARARSTLGLAITGWAGPSGGTADDPIGTVYVALAEAGRTRAWRFVVAGGRAEVREAAVALAIERVRDWCGERRGG